MKEVNNIIRQAVEKKQKALSEYDSKRVMHLAGVPITKEILAQSKDEAIEFAETTGYPVVLKGCSDKAVHKTEMGIVKLNVKSKNDLIQAYDEIISKGFELDGILVQEMIDGNREFVAGLTHDSQFGACVVFGLGGIFTEVFKDVSFRVVPITEYDALEMINEIKTNKLLDEFRGSPAVDKNLLVNVLTGISKLCVENMDIAEIDINPLKVSGNKPVAVDALIVLKAEKKT